MISGKDPRAVESGRRGAEKRWSDPANRRVVRLDSLEPPVAAAVRALLAADRDAKARTDTAAPEAAKSAHREAAPVIGDSGTAMEARRGRDELPPAA